MFKCHKSGPMQGVPDWPAFWSGSACNRVIVGIGGGGAWEWLEGRLTQA